MYVSKLVLSVAFISVRAAIAEILPPDPTTDARRRQGNCEADGEAAEVAGWQQTLLQTQLSMRKRLLYPSIAVAITTRRSSFKQRSLIRGMWQRASNSPRPIVYRFVLCNHTSEANESESLLLSDEAKEFGDLMLLDCHEGYRSLTEKTLAAMHSYQETFKEWDLFMKVDDDTFVAWSRFYDYVAQATQKHGSAIYLGYFYCRSQHGDGDPDFPLNCGLVSRNESNKFFESVDAYPYPYYPESASGGPGYVLSSELLGPILERAATKQTLVGMEDKAVGVYLKEAMERTGIPVAYVHVPAATEGYFWDDPYMPEWGRWGDYPYMLQHNLTGVEIACLAQVESAGDENATADCSGD